VGAIVFIIAGSVEAATQRAERFEHGQIGLSGTELLDALAMRHHGRREPVGERIDQGRLAHAGIAGDPADLRPAGTAAFPLHAQANQRFLPPDHARDRDGFGQRDERRRARRCGDGADRTDESITPAGRSFDVTRLGRVVGQRGAHLTDRRLEHGFADVLVTPDRVEQRVLADQLAGVARQGAQDGESLGRQGNGRTVRRQTRIRLVELEGIETQRRWGGVAHRSFGRVVPDPVPSYAPAKSASATPVKWIWANEHRSESHAFRKRGSCRNRADRVEWAPPPR
jgi:hypothetical protein